MKALAIFFFSVCGTSFVPQGNFCSGRRDCGTAPELNRQVVEFVKTKIHQRVGRGECWDLAAAALNNAGASWDHRYNFGKEINASRECVYPGDIIQCEGVPVKFQKDWCTY